MVSRQETIDENIVPLRLSRKRSSKKTREKFELKRHTALFGYAALAFVSFLVFFVSSLPLERLSSQVLQILSEQTQMEWNAESVHIGVLFGPKISFEKLTISPRSGSASTDLFSRLIGEGVTIDKLSFRPSILALLPAIWEEGDRMAGSFSAEIYGADIDGFFGHSPTLSELSVELDGLDVKKVPQVNALGDIQGEIQDLRLSLSSPRGRIGSASGEIQLVADKLKVDPASLPNTEMLRSVLEKLGTLNLGKLEARGKLTPGRLTIGELSMGGKDSDIEVKLEGELSPKDEIMLTSMNLLLSITPSQKLQSLLPLVASITQMEKQASNTYTKKIIGTFLQYANMMTQ